MAKLQDIAKLTGVSVSTVSRALHSRQWVRAEVRARVLAAARQLHYSGGNRSIAVVLDRSSLFRNAYLGMVLDELRSQLDARQESMELVFEGSEELLFGRMFSGAILISNWTDFAARWAARQGLPLVDLNAGPLIGGGVPSVTANDRQGIELALECFRRNGHRKIGFFLTRNIPEGEFPGIHFVGPGPLPGRLADNHNITARAATYRDWMAHHFPDIRPLLLCADRFGEIGECMRQTGTTALLVNGEGNAFEVASRLLRNGVRIPEELSIIVFNDPSTSPLMIPAPTAIAQNIPEMIRLVLEMLDRMRAGVPVSGEHFVDYTLIERETVRPACG